MIKTTLEWYTLDEKLPFDGKMLRIDAESDIICLLNIRDGIERIESLNWMDNQIMVYDDGEWGDITHMVKYWAYVPEIGVE